MGFRGHIIRAGLLRTAVITACGALAACTVGDVMRPSVDVGAVTRSVPPSLPATVTPLQPVMPLQPVAPATNIMTSAGPATAAPAGIIPATALEPWRADGGDWRNAAPVTAIDPVAPQRAMSSPIVPLTVEEERQSPSVPVPSLSIDEDKASETQDSGLLTKIAALPGSLIPDFLKPGGSGSEAECRRKLRAIGARFEDIPTVGSPGGRSCGIAHPVRLTALSGGIKIKPAAVLNCKMALTFAEWVKQDVVPAARTRYLSGVDSIEQMSSYSCRTIGNKRGGTPSEHSYGNAIDIGAITLNNGHEIDVRKPGLFSFREKSLLNTVRADACDHFTTVLGPGYNSDHADHFHLDLMSRRRNTCK